MLAMLAFISLKLISNKRQKDKELDNFRTYEQVTPVNVTSVSYLPFEETLIETGVFKACRDVNLVSKTQGLILQLKVKIGDKVRKGELLAAIDKGLLEEQLSLALLNMRTAEEDLHRYESLAECDAVTDQQLEQIMLKYENAVNQVAIIKEQLENTNILAPVDGYISSRSIARGSYVSPGMSLMSISDQSRLLFMVQVAESSIGHINPGERVLVSTSSFPEECLEGLVYEVAVNCNLSGRYSVSIIVDNSPASLRPGMTGQARFFFQKRDEIILPRNCIISSMLDPAVYLISGDSVIERKVKARLLNESRVLIQDGLREGEQVVLSGHINLVSGSKIQITK